MNITVFGGAQVKEGTAAYEEARELGALLAQNGHTVLTGGYMGTMEAVSRGATEAGGHVIGVTCIDIEVWRKTSPNQWVKEERRKKTLIERIQALIEGCDAAIALPGGAGTLAEISLMWNLMIVESLPPRPLTLIGSGWQSTFDQFFHEFENYMPNRQRELLYFADDVKTAVEKINVERKTFDVQPEN
ncbi:MAG: LOG family protein [Chloroflexi bacterium]|nr:LOG family protein [Chloroflexota bacterium]